MLTWIRGDKPSGVIRTPDLSGEVSKETTRPTALGSEQGCVCCVRDFKDQSKPSKLCALQGLSSQPFIFLPFYHGPMGLKGFAKVTIDIYKVGFEESDGDDPCGVKSLRELAETAPEEMIQFLISAMAFLTAVASSSNATSSEGNNASGQAMVVKCYNYQGEGHMARQCTQPKRPRNATWYKKKVMLAEAHEAGQILDEGQLTFLVDLGVPDGQAVPHSETYLNDMENQSVHAMQDFEQTPTVDFTDNGIHTDSNIIPYSQYLQETQQANVQDINLQAQQDSMILSVIE
ncbi:hypothetical protein Tco_1069846 [Tanacetum coccineum]|uniref:Retrovirus-related Pol polyprotein from transposon TNT 1-94 n=1 Tax=Tanacetum coccineum TaxID=301880 RepID=A0ABQ5HKV0_9ASTR